MYCSYRDGYLIMLMSGGVMHEWMTLRPCDGDLNTALPSSSLESSGLPLDTGAALMQDIPKTRELRSAEMWSRHCNPMLERCKQNHTEHRNITELLRKLLSLRKTHRDVLFKNNWYQQVQQGNRGINMSCNWGYDPHTSKRETAWVVQAILWLETPPPGLPSHLTVHPKTQMVSNHPLLCLVYEQCPPLARFRT